jgi:hypothetical protein
LAAEVAEVLERVSGDVEMLHAVHLLHASAIWRAQTRGNARWQSGWAQVVMVPRSCRTSGPAWCPLPRCRRS